MEKQMFDDLALSYPGNNGFSLDLAELELDAQVGRLLDDAVAHGNLFDAPHTTKEKNRRPRRKWYLNPILSPHFRLPQARTKEPMYVNLEEVRSWMKQLELPIGDTPLRIKTKARQRINSDQSTLF